MQGQEHQKTWGQTMPKFGRAKRQEPATANAASISWQSNKPQPRDTDTLSTPWPLWYTRYFIYKQLEMTLQLMAKPRQERGKGWQTKARKTNVVTHLFLINFPSKIAEGNWPTSLATGFPIVNTLWWRSSLTLEKILESRSQKMEIPTEWVTFTNKKCRKFIPWNRKDQKRIPNRNQDKTSFLFISLFCQCMQPCVQADGHGPVGQ